jgi:hypothetical protein
MVAAITGLGILVLIGLLIAYRTRRVPLSPDAYIWTDTEGRHHVIMDGRQTGLWTKRRWAEWDLRDQVSVREEARQS